MYHFFPPYPWSNVQLYALLLSQVPHEVQVVAEKYCKKRETARVRTMYIYIYTRVYYMCNAQRSQTTVQGDQHHNSQLNVCRTRLQHAYIGYISKYVRPQSSIMSTNVSVHVRILSPGITYALMVMDQCPAILHYCTATGRRHSIGCLQHLLSAGQLG